MAIGYPYLKLGHKFHRNSVIFQPSTDSTTFLQVLDADGGTPILNIDSTNERVGISTASPEAKMDIDASATSQVAMRVTGHSSNNNVFQLRADGTNPHMEIGETNGQNMCRLYYNTADNYSAIQNWASNTAQGVLALNPTAGSVGIGTTSPDTLLELSKATADTEFTISCYHDTEATTPKITLRKADNTEASPALVDDNAVLGTISFQGHDGSGWHEGAKIEARIDGTPSDGTDMPTELTFWTTADGAGSPTERLTITPSGECLFVDGSVTNPAIAFKSDADGTGTGIYSPAADQLAVAINGVQLLGSYSGGMWIAENKSLFFDGGSDTQLISPSNDVLEARVGGVTAWQIAEDTTVTTRMSDKLRISNSAENHVGSLDIITAREVHTLANAATSDTSINIPADCMLLGAAFCVNTAVTDDGGDDTWSAAFNDGAGMHTLVSGAAAAQNTKANKLVDSSATSTITDAVTNVQFTPNGGNFTAGVIEVIVWYVDMTDLGNA